MSSKLEETVLYKNMPETDREKVLSLLNRYSNSHITLSEMLNVNPDIYSNTPIDSIGLSSRSVNAMTWGRHGRHNETFTICTLCDLLNCSMYQIKYIRNLGRISLFEVIYTVSKYISKHKEVKFADTISYSAYLNQNRLAYGLNRIINGEPLNKIVFREEEMPYIMRYMAAVEWIDKDLCMAAYNKDEYLIEIITALSEFFAPMYRVYQYKQAIENSFIKLPRELREKSAKYFFQAYLLNNSVLEENPLYGAAEETTILDIVNNVCRKSDIDYNTFHYVYDFLQWLDFDFNLEISDVIRNLKGEKRQTIKTRRNRYCNRIKDLYLNFGYDIVAVVRAFKGKSRLVYKKDLISFIGKDNTELLWFALSSVNYSTSIYHYSAETDVMIFNE